MDRSFLWTVECENKCTSSREERFNILPVAVPQVTNYLGNIGDYEKLFVKHFQKVASLKDIFLVR